MTKLRISLRRPPPAPIDGGLAVPLPTFGAFPPDKNDVSGHEWALETPPPRTYRIEFHVVSRLDPLTRRRISFWATVFLGLDLGWNAPLPGGGAPLQLQCQFNNAFGGGRPPFLIPGLLGFRPLGPLTSRVQRRCGAWKNVLFPSVLTVQLEVFLTLDAE